MKNAKKIIVLCIALAFVLTACGGATQGANNPYGGTFDIEQIEHAPHLYVGQITLIGIVGDSETQDFSLQTSEGTFHVLVDYRGSQSLPQFGEEIIVEGELRTNRPCCGPGFTIRSIQFERVN
ncbi:MAG: hypothetical protein FWE05_06290 [Defluviitaleaceae bacterium]|nr:hypothetical protein [Defluviitaleaceae bacterium]